VCECVCVSVCVCARARAHACVCVCVYGLRYIYTYMYICKFMYIYIYKHIIYELLRGKHLGHTLFVSPGPSATWPSRALAPYLVACAVETCQFISCAHTHALSLSLSLSHTHTHTPGPAGQGFSPGCQACIALAVIDAAAMLLAFFFSAWSRRCPCAVSVC